jgi:hypothetical protein
LKAGIYDSLSHQAQSVISEDFSIRDDTTMTSSKPSKRQKTLLSSLPDSIQNFILLPITLPSPLPSVHSAVHIIYVRKHEEPPVPPAITSTEASRTLFLVNIPIDSTKEILRGLFASLGPRPEEIRIHGQTEVPTEDDLPAVWDRRLSSSGGTAHATFSSPKDVDAILKAISKERRSQNGPIREWGVGVDYPFSSLGFPRLSLDYIGLTVGYLSHYKLRYPDKAQLQSLVDTALTRFNEAESARMLSLKGLQSEPDEEGFITVTRKERNEPVAEKKNKSMDLEDFYKFQKREKRQKRMQELRRKFEEDRLKVERAKEGRHFKPF